MLKLIKKLFGTLDKEDLKNEVSQSKTDDPIKVEIHTTSASQIPDTPIVKKSRNTFPYNVPIIDLPPERGFNRDFRKSADDLNVIKVNQYQPEGFPRKVEEFISIAGITQEGRQKDAVKFMSGKERQIELRREPNNPYDNNAIEVYGHYVLEGKSHSCKLGYLPAKTAKELLEEDEIRATLKVMYYPLEGKSAGIRIDLWGKRKPSEVKVKVQEMGRKEIKIPRGGYEKNALGQELEKEGFIENAIELYELNIKNGFDGNFPYDRLAVIYRKRKQHADEVRVLERAVKVFDKLTKTSPRQDVNPKLVKFKDRLSKATELLEKQK